MTAVAIREREQIIQRLAAGQDLRQIAPDLGVSSAAISQYLAKDPAYRAAREQGIAQKIEECEEEIKTASDALNLARARERFRVVSWRAEREFPATWGQRQQFESVVPIQIMIGVDLASHQSGDCLTIEQQKDDK